MTLEKLGEFALIERFFRRAPKSSAVVLGGGDDAALLRPAPGFEFAVSVDMLVSGRHFFPDVDPEALGHKALAVNLSDIAAMGATPRWALLAGAMPDNDPEWYDAFARGFFALADAFGIELIGGDTTRGPLNLCVTIMGEVPAGQAVRRSGAKAGDDIYVSGTIGDAALALAAMTGRTTLADDDFDRCRNRLLRPTPRVALGRRLRGVASAMLDVSDGLCGDLGHLLEASKVGARVEVAAIPRPECLSVKQGGDERAVALACLLAGGDDYELCFTAPPERAGRVAAIAEGISLPLTKIGSITASPGLTVLDEQGIPIDALPRSFDHFATPDAGESVRTS